MENKERLITIKDIQEIKSTMGRYGIKFFVSCDINGEEIFFNHIIWLGNYKDFNYDKNEKSNILWSLAASNLEKIGFSTKDLSNLSAMKNKINSFKATLKLTQNYFTPEDSLAISIIIDKII